MHLLPCPDCRESIPVAPSQAGGQINCPNCQASVNLPKLGDIRQLPLADSAPSEPMPVATAEPSLSRRLGFGVMAGTAAICLIVGGYCGIRWLLTDVPLTTDQHIETVREGLKTADPALLIREYEDMEEFGLELPEPYRYRIAGEAKRAWRRNALFAGAVGLVSFLLAIWLALAGRRRGTTA